VSASNLSFLSLAAFSSSYAFLRLASDSAYFFLASFLSASVFLISS
jgi:hypothetical protein